MSIEVLLKEFAEISEHPRRQIQAFKAEGKKVIGVLPYYAPEELVYAAGMVPMGIWGSNKKTISMAKEYCATFYCTIAQLALEMLLDGTLDDLDGLITPTISMTINYACPVPLDASIVVRTRTVRCGATAGHIEAEVYPAGQPETLLVTASGAYSTKPNSLSGGRAPWEEEPAP